jgi:hypothetical protein
MYIMATRIEKVFCRTPTPGKQGTQIERWKYDAVRTAIQHVVPTSKRGIEFRRLAPLVAATFSAEIHKRIGSIRWYTVTVKLHMEVLGEIERIAGSKPQRIRRLR